MDRYVLQNIDEEAVLHHIGFYDRVEAAREHIQFILSVAPESNLKLFFGAEELDWDDPSVTTLELE